MAHCLCGQTAFSVQPATFMLFIEIGLQRLDRTITQSKTVCIEVWEYLHFGSLLIAAVGHFVHAVLRFRQPVSHAVGNKHIGAWYCCFLFRFG